MGGTGGLRLNLPCAIALPALMPSVTSYIYVIGGIQTSDIHREAGGTISAETEGIAGGGARRSTATCTLWFTASTALT